MAPKNNVPTEIPNAVAPFDFGAGPPRALLLHGFTGSPGEVRATGEHLAKTGWRVQGPLLPGHGTVIEDLDQVTAQDWIDTVDNAIERIGQETDQPIAVIGLSMGGLLALLTAIRHPQQVGALAILAAPLQYSHWSVSAMLSFIFAIRLERILRRIPKRESNLPPEAEAKRFVYDCYPTAGIREFSKVMALTRNQLHKVHVPLISFYSHSDPTAPPLNQSILSRGAQSITQEHHLLHKSGHILPLDLEAELVHDRIEKFMERHLSH